MIDDNLIDERLTALFAEPAVAPDEAFVGRIQRAVLAEQRIAAARKTLWLRFGIEAAGSVAVTIAFVLLGRLGPFALELGEGPSGPGLAAGLVLLLWLAVELRPAAAEACKEMPEGL